MKTKAVSLCLVGCLFGGSVLACSEISDSEAIRLVSDYFASNYGVNDLADPERWELRVSRSKADEAVVIAASLPLTPDADTLLIISCDRQVRRLSRHAPPPIPVEDLPLSRLPKPKLSGG